MASTTHLLIFCLDAGDPLLEVQNIQTTVHLYATGQLCGHKHLMPALGKANWAFPCPHSEKKEGALECRMVSTTSVERPESMSWAPSEAKPTVSTVLVGGEISNPHLGKKVPPDGELQRRPVDKGYYIWEPYSARPPQGNEK